MNVVHITLNEIRLISKDRLSLTLVLIMPILMILLMGYALRPSFEAMENIIDLSPTYTNEGEILLHYSNDYGALIANYNELSPSESREDALRLLLSIEKTMGKNFISIEKPHGINNGLTSFQHFSASMLIFFLLTTGMGLGMNIIKERLDKTYMRICSFPVSKNEYLLGKLIGNGCIGIIQSIVIVMVAHYVFNVNWGNRYLGVGLVSLLIIFISSACGILLSSILNSPKAITASLTIVFWLMTFISGGFTGVSILEPLPSFTVNKWAFEAISKLMAGGNLNTIRIELLVLSLIAVGLWIIGVLLYSRRVSHE